MVDRIDQLMALGGPDDVVVLACQRWVFALPAAGVLRVGFVAELEQLDDLGGGVRAARLQAQPVATCDLGPLLGLSATDQAFCLVSLLGAPVALRCSEVLGVHTLPAEQRFALRHEFTAPSGAVGAAFAPVELPALAGALPQRVSASGFVLDEQRLLSAAQHAAVRSVFAAV